MIHERMLEENWGMNYLMQAVKLSDGSVESCRSWQRRVKIYSTDQLGPCGLGGDEEHWRWK